MLTECKEGFPAPLRQQCGLNDEGLKWLYVRRHVEDAYIVPYNLNLLMAWGAHINVQPMGAAGST